MSEVLGVIGILTMIVLGIVCIEGLKTQNRVLVKNLVTHGIVEFDNKSGERYYTSMVKCDNKSCDDKLCRNNEEK